MSLHSLAATVISTAVVSAGATTVVNQMVGHRWRRTRRRLGRLLGKGDDRARAIVEAELEAYADLVTRAKGSQNRVLRQHLGTVIEARMDGFVTSHPEAAGELRALLADLGTPAPQLPGTPDPDGPKHSATTTLSGADLEDLSEPELERLGGMAWRDGDFDLAKREYELALLKATTPAAKARALNNLGTTHDKLGEWERAINSFTRAIDVYRAIGDEHGEAEALTNLGLALGRQGQHGQATAHLRDALRLHHHNGDRFGQASALSVLAELERAHGDLDTALTTHRRALEIYCELSRADAEATCLNDCATTLLEMNQVKGALTAYANALTVAQLVGADAEQARAHDGIARILFSQGDRTGARTHWSLAWRLFQDSDSDSAQAVAARLRQLN